MQPAQQIGHLGKVEQGFPSLLEGSTGSAATWIFRMGEMVAAKHRGREVMNLDWTFAYHLGARRFLGKAVYDDVNRCWSCYPTGVTAQF